MVRGSRAWCDIVPFGFGKIDQTGEEKDCDDDAVLNAIIFNDFDGVFPRNFF